MAPWHGKLYVSSSRDNSYKPLWEYDPAFDKWSQVQMELTQYGGSLCNLNGNLFYIPGSMARWHGESEEVRGAQISIIDPETKTVKKLKGDVKGNRYAGGIVMVGDSVEGTDTYMLMDSEKTLRPCPRKSTYHRLNYATAAVQGKDLYVIGANQTENDTFYFRSTELPVEIVPVTGLKAKKTYYVQIRTYKKTGGKTHYSAWSKKKSVKTR